MPTDFAPHNMTSNTAPSPYVVWGYNNASATNAPYYLFNGAVDDYYYAHSPASWSMSFFLGAGNAHVLDSYGIQGVATGQSVTYDPKNWTVTGLNSIGMTSANTPSPYVVSASSTYGDFLAWYAFTGSNDRWLANSSTSGWLQIDLGSGNSLTLLTYGIVAADDDNRAPKDWTMLGSNDETNWDTLDTVSNETGWTSCQARTYTCDVQTTAYRYFRLNITAANAGNYLGLREFTLGDPWILLDTKANQTSWSLDQLQTFNCDAKPRAFTTFGFNLTANNGGTYAGFSELYLYEAAGGGHPAIRRFGGIPFARQQSNGVQIW